MASSAVSVSRDPTPRPSDHEPPPVSSPSLAHVESRVTDSSEEKGTRSSGAESQPGNPNGADDAALPLKDSSLLATMDPRSSVGPDPDVKEEPDRPPEDTGTPDKSSSKSQPSHAQEEDAEDSKEPITRRSSDAQASQTTANNATGSARKQANGTIGSVYSGNKIRHLKKDDGVPLWRRDIQFRFLTLVFDDKTPVFTRMSDRKEGCTFADIYVDAMSKSSKTSKILKEKLQNDRPAALHMAMVCLLVNFGRMNTTLNFFPEMRAQLRTYHPIPSLQAHNDDSNAYKQLQDAPRLKSILKGASEDTDQPGTIEKIKRSTVPRTNPVNLIFVLSQYAPRISELHFFHPRDFFDLVMGATLSSRSRARAFLWLMWYYLESDFTTEGALDNPFGRGLVGEGTNGQPLKVPALKDLTEEEADAENVDTPEEIQYGEEKQRERKRILVEDDVLFRYSKRQKKGTQDYTSDDQASEDIPGGVHTAHATGAKGERPIGGPRGSDEQASMTSTPVNQSSKRGAADIDEEDQTPPQTLRPRAKRTKRDSSMNRAPGSQPQQRIVLKTRMDQTPDTASPAPPGAAHPVLNQYGGASPAPHPNSASGPRRPRPLTQHQLALEQNRRQRVDYLLAQRRSEALKDYRAQRESEVPFVRAGRLLKGLPDGYDTDDENSWGKGGVCPNPEIEEDYGEAASFYLSVLRKTARRLQRWDWDAVASGETDNWVNDLGRGYKLASWNGYAPEPEVAPEAPPPPSKPKGRGGRRKTAATATEGEKPATGKRGGRTSTTGGRKRASGVKSRASGRASKAGDKKAVAKREAEPHDGSPVPESRHQFPPVAQEHEDDLDDLDRELLGEVSGGEETHLEPPHNPRPGEASPASSHRLDDHHEEEGEDDGSSVYHGHGPPPEETGHASDTDPMSDEDVASPAVGANGYAGDETSSMEMDTTLAGHGEESMVDV